jgi:hypothetical protein
MSGDWLDPPQASDRRERITLHLVRGVALAGGIAQRVLDRALGPQQTRQMIAFLQRMFRKTARPRPVGGRGRARADIGRSTNESALDRLLVGRSKQEVHRKLGAPRNATTDGAIVGVDADQPLFWQATTWYYAFDSAERTAMAVHFAGNTVRRIELIRTGADKPAQA